MDMILSVVQYFIDLGAAVMLPLVIFVIAILLGTPLSRSVKRVYTFSNILEFVICTSKSLKFCRFSFQNQFFGSITQNN